MTENVMISVITGIFMLAGTALSGYFGYSKGKKNKDKEPNRLENHHYFSKVEIIKSEISRTFRLPNRGKEVVFRDILFNNINIIVEKNLETVKEIEKHEDLYENNSALSALLIDSLNDILMELCCYYQKDPRYTKEEKSVLDIVMGKYSVWSNEKVHNMQDQIINTCHSPFYADSSPLIKTSIILDQYLAFTIDLVHSATRTLDQINGDLKGLVYKGIVI